MVGRVKTVLINGPQDGAGAVITRIAVVTHASSASDRVRFTGPGTFDANVQSHIRDVILPLADRILATLQQPQQSYELSLANPGASAVIDRGTCVSGFSADVPVLLAMLSAGLGIPVGDDLVATGHVSSVQGDIAMVAGLPTKVSAALSDGSIRRLVHPALDGDTSLRVLAPRQLELAEAALRTAVEKLETISVHDVGELIAATFDGDDVVTASLQRGFFEVVLPPDTPADPVTRALQYLTADPPRRFWALLERRLLAGDGGKARELLSAFTAYHLEHGRYPGECGRQLLELVRSLPPAVRRLKRLFPLLSTEDVIRLSQHADKTQHEDVPLLLHAAAGRNTTTKTPRPTHARADEAGARDVAEATLEAILDEISADALATKFDRPIDEARATYRPGSAALESYDEFLDAVTAFYLHLMRHAGLVKGGVDVDAVGADAHACLEAAFVRSGGSQAAWTEVRYPRRGGLSLVFNAMANQFKNEAHTKHVRWVFKNAMDPRDWDARVALMAAFLRRVGPQLPPDIRFQPAERFARRYEAIVDAYVRSLDRLETLLRSI